MRKSLGLLLVLGVLLSLTVHGTAQAEELALPTLRVADKMGHFEDISESAWYYLSVRACYEQGLMSGMSRAIFAPRGSMTRAMYVTVLGRIADVDTALYNRSSHFADVPDGTYYTCYVNWAYENGIVSGMDATSFAPNRDITREQAAAMLDRYIKTLELTADANATEPFADLDRVSDWALESVLGLQRFGLMQGDNNHNFNPKQLITRAEGATVFVRLNQLIYGNKVKLVNDWFDRGPYDAIPEVRNPIISTEALRTFMEQNAIAYNSQAYKALIRINSVYAAQIPASLRSQPILFVFEGCGANADPNVRMDALAVVLAGGRITYYDRYSSTIPDYPFDPLMNDGTTPMPTAKAGVYACTPVNHMGYAAWHVEGCPVVRFRSQYQFYESSSQWINIHRRTKDVLAPYGGGWTNSSGCILIGRSGVEPEDPYAGFIQAIGLVVPGMPGNIPFQLPATGTFVLDRSLARAYLRAVGYPEDALELLGCQ